MWATIAFVITVSILGLFAWRSRPLPFDSATWINKPLRRSQMVGDLVEHEKLVGKSREEIHVLLGTPSSEDVDGTAYAYWIGYAGIDDDWFEVDFQGDVVSAVRQLSD